MEGTPALSTYPKAEGLTGEWCEPGIVSEFLDKSVGSSLGYFDHCNDYYSYRAQTPFQGGLDKGGLGGPCHLLSSEGD